jgi:hypothetical protein
MSAIMKALLEQKQREQKRRESDGSLAVIRGVMQTSSGTAERIS